jgi:major outer membrane protein
MSSAQSFLGRISATFVASVSVAASVLFSAAQATAQDDFAMAHDQFGVSQDCADQCASGCGDRCARGDCCDRCCGPWCHRSGVFGEFLWLHPTGVDMVHAQQQDGLGGAGTVPFGKIAATDPDYEPGFRVGGAVALSDVSSLGVSYTFFESDSVSSVEAPIIPGGGGAVGSLVQHPGAAITASPGPVTGVYEIDFQLADAEYRRLLVGDDLGWMNYSVGARYAHLEEEFLQTGVFSGSQAGDVHTRTDIEFDGGGASFGIDGEHVIGRRGLSVYGGLGVSPVFGQFSSFYDLTNASTDARLARAEWKDDRVVTILDFEVGLAWTGPCRRWRLATGYVASFWYNAITTPEFVDAVQANNYTDVGDTISFDGLAARIERRF